MKKRKTYEISVIDKTYSKIISDETKFYTSDTALELGFKLKETEYNFESAEIVLLNIDDRSLVTRTVIKSSDSFAYELDDDITAHYGEWRGQLRFEQAGETYVSSPVKFRIENDLSNDRPPQLSDVQSWVSLKRYADSLVDELKQAVLSVEGIEDTFNENETIRQTNFETAEQSRQTTFEANESERDSTFNANETIRQAQELEREGAEATRQTIFDGNEAIRFETFNTNEATRQENETTRQQAEGERESAESNRVSAEEQRKIDHANRSAELDGKADKVVIQNLIDNGDFSQGGLNWFGFGEIQEDLVISETYRLYQDTKDKNIASNDIIYISTFLQNDLNSRNDETPVLIGVTGNLANVGGATKSEINMFSRRFVKGSNNIATVSVGQFDRLNLDITKGFILLNLTQIFGVGNEPTKEEMDELIKTTGYIDGEYALNNKELLIWTLALVRRNKNAIITLGGTI